MKKIFFLTVLLSVFTLSFASIGIDDNKKNRPIDITEKTFEKFSQKTESFDLCKDCTVRLDFNLGDGTTIQGEITFEDVTWWQCTKMQLAAWWKRNF